MLKNWTIITQAVKHGAEGVLVREKYLTSQKHPNHRLTDNLISIIGNKETSKRIALAGEEFRVNQHLYQKKGGNASLKLCGGVLSDTTKRLPPYNKTVAGNSERLLCNTS